MENAGAEKRGIVFCAVNEATKFYRSIFLEPARSDRQPSAWDGMQWLAANGRKPSGETKQLPRSGRRRKEYAYLRHRVVVIRDVDHRPRRRCVARSMAEQMVLQALCSGLGLVLLWLCSCLLDEFCLNFEQVIRQFWPTHRNTLSVELSQRVIVAGIHFDANIAP